VVRGGVFYMGVRGGVCHVLETLVGLGVWSEYSWRARGRLSGVLILSIIPLMNLMRVCVCTILWYRGVHVYPI
jgi:hypothetical protein